MECVNGDIKISHGNSGNIRLKKVQEPDGEMVEKVVTGPGGR